MRETANFGVHPIWQECGYIVVPGVSERRVCSFSTTFLLIRLQIVVEAATTFWQWISLRLVFRNSSNVCVAMLFFYLFSSPTHNKELVHNVSELSLTYISFVYYLVPILEFAFAYFARLAFVNYSSRSQCLGFVTYLLFFTDLFNKNLICKWLRTSWGSEKIECLLDGLD